MNEFNKENSQPSGTSIKNTHIQHDPELFKHQIEYDFFLNKSFFLFFLLHLSILLIEEFLRNKF